MDRAKQPAAKLYFQGHAFPSFISNDEGNYAKSSSGGESTPLQLLRLAVLGYRRPLAWEEIYSVRCALNFTLTIVVVLITNVV